MPPPIATRLLAQLWVAQRRSIVVNGICGSVEMVSPIGTQERWASRGTLATVPDHPLRRGARITWQAQMRNASLCSGIEGVHRRESCLPASGRAAGSRLSDDARAK